MTDSPSLDGRNIIVTGATGAPGRAVTGALAAAGAHVVATDRSQEALQALADEVMDEISAGTGGQRPASRVLPMAADLLVPDQCGRLVTRAHLSFGALHGLVHCAGMEEGGEDAGARFWEIPPEHWQEVFDRDVRAAFLLARAAAGYFLEQGRGRIVSVTTSGNAMLAAQSASWASDFDDTGVTVNLLIADAPPEALAPPTVWLLSDDAAHLTGARLSAAAWDSMLPGRAAVEGALVRTPPQ